MILMAKDWLTDISTSLTRLTNDDDDEDKSKPEVGSSEENGDDDSQLYTGSSAGSSFGMGQILATVNYLKTLFPISTPFDNTLMNAPDYLIEIYQLLLTTVFDDKEFQVRNTIFLSDQLKIDLNDTQTLDQLTTNVIPANFKNDSVVNVINSDILKKTRDVGLNQSYIPTEKLPKSLRAMLVHTLSYSEKWSIPFKRIGKGTFYGNGEENVEFVEVIGNFPYLESDRAIEVSIPIKNDTTRVLSLILPRNIQDALDGRLGDASNGTARLRLQIPLFNFTVRVPHNGGVGSRECNGEKLDNFLNVVDDLTFVNLDEEGISAVAITGVQIHNVREYREELRIRNQTTITKAADKSINNNSTTTTISNDSSSTLPEPEKLIGTPTDSQSNKGNSLDKSRTTDDENEKLIRFDRPFTLTIVDDSVFPIPIFSAALVSLSNMNFDLRTVVSKNQTSLMEVFGLDHTIRNWNCL